MPANGTETRDREKKNVMVRQFEHRSSFIQFRSSSNIKKDFMFTNLTI